MLVELKAKSQITIPKDIVNSMRLNQGDQFEIVEKEGKILLIPVAIYPQEKIAALKRSVIEVKKAIESGAQPVFDSIEGLFEELER